MKHKPILFIAVLTLTAALLLGCAPTTLTNAPLQNAASHSLRNLQSLDSDSQLSSAVHAAQPAAEQLPIGKQSDTPTATEIPVVATNCNICGEYDCDDGIYCDDWDEKQENLHEQENIRNHTPCDICGEYDCDDGIYCDDWDDRYDDHHSTKHHRHHD